MEIMLVDDDQFSLIGINSALTIRGHQCSTFNDPLRAVEEYSKEKYDLVIADYQMPEMNGTEMIDEISKKNPNVKAVLLTGFIKEFIASKGAKIPYYPILEKPMCDDELFEIIRKLEDEISNEQKESLENG